MIKRGIDISAHNGEINLLALKSQIDFVIIRVGYGTKGTIDTKFKRNVELCKELKIPFGFYWYSYALNKDGANAEADAMIAAIAPYKDSYSMGVWFDMEDADGYKKKNGMPSNQMLRNICKAFCSRLENEGYYCGIYASESWFKNQLAGEELKRYDRWVAQWPANGSIEKGLSVLPNEKNDLNMWQFTSAGRFNGHNGLIDVNYAYKDEFRCGGAVQSNPEPEIRKSIDELAREVIDGQWGDGEDRSNRLIAAGYDYNAVQSKVNELLTPPKKSIDEIAHEIINGSWGDGEDRKNRIAAAGYNYDEVQKRVNEILSINNAIYHIVKKGDTLSKIGAKYGVNWRTIAKNNNIKGPKYIIYDGQKLKIK